jgi:hypothetical protein
MSKSIKEKIDEIFNKDNLDEVFAPIDYLSLDSMLDTNDVTDDEVDATNEEDLNWDDYDDDDEIMHELLDIEDELKKARGKFEGIDLKDNLDARLFEADELEESTIGDLISQGLTESDIIELEEDSSRTLAQLIKKKKQAYKNKKALISKIGLGAFRKKQIIAKKKRRVNKVKLKLKRNKYLKSAAGKRAVRISRKRVASLNGRAMADIVKIPKIGGIAGRTGTSGK